VGDVVGVGDDIGEGGAVGVTVAVGVGGMDAADDGVVVAAALDVGDAVLFAIGDAGAVGELSAPEPRAAQLASPAAMKKNNHERIRARFNAASRHPFCHNKHQGMG
jgi:hypothetical protein